MLSIPSEVLEEAARPGRGGRRRRLVAAGRGGLGFKHKSVVPAAALGSQRPGPRLDGVLRPRARRRAVVGVAERSLDVFVIEAVHERGPVGDAPGVIRRRLKMRTRARSAELGVGLDALEVVAGVTGCLLYTSPSPRDGLLSRMPSSA